MKILMGLLMLFSGFFLSAANAQWVYYEKNPDGSVTEVDPRLVDLSWPQARGELRRKWLIYNEIPHLQEFEAEQAKEAVRRRKERMESGLFWGY